MKKDLLDLATAKAKLAAVAIAALAVGGTAATVGGISFTPVDSSTDVTVSPSPTATGGPAEGSQEADNDADGDTEATPDATESAAPDATGASVVCPEGVKNHGAFVSSVAKDKTLTGSEHGKAVSAAAQSDCGKPAQGEDADEADDSDDAAGADGDETESAQKPKKDKAEHGKGHGKGHQG